MNGQVPEKHYVCYSCGCRYKPKVYSGMWSASMREANYSPCPLCGAAGIPGVLAAPCAASWDGLYLFSRCDFADECAKAGVYSNLN